MFAFIAAIATAALVVPALASAQATRTWVSGVGDDVNPCSRTAPCKTFAGAISKTASGGIINALDPGGFGTVTINKPITLMGPPGMAEILSSGAPAAININYTSPSARPVILRNLDLSGGGTTMGTDGIRMLNGSELRLQNVSIDSYSGDGIEVNTGHVYANNLHITDAGVGLRFNANGGLGGTFKNVDITGGSYGVIANGGSTNVTLNNCVVANEAQGGIYANAARVQVNGCEVHDNNIGIWAEFNSVTRVSDTTITNNNFGVYTTTGGGVLSRGNNTLEDNGAGNAFTGLYSPK
jgi:hypothetical protein